MPAKRMEIAQTSFAALKFHIEMKSVEAQHKNICKWHKLSVFFFCSKIGLTAIKMMTPIAALSHACYKFMILSLNT